MLPNISRSKRKQAMKLGQFIEYKIKKIFFPKSYTKCSRENTKSDKILCKF